MWIVVQQKVQFFIGIWLDVIGSNYDVRRPRTNEICNTTQVMIIGVTITGWQSVDNNTKSIIYD